MTRLAQKKKFSVSTFSRTFKKYEEKVSDVPGLSAAMVLKLLERSPRLLNDPKNYGNRIPIISDEKTFTVVPAFSKQNNRVVTFGNNESEHHRVSTTRRIASIMILDMVASNGEKMPPVWLNGATG